jgi:hypothetical protein
MSVRRSAAARAAPVIATLICLTYAVGVRAGDLELPWLDNDFYKVNLDVRARISLANIDFSDKAQAYTLRTRAGLLAKPFHGFSAYAELEHTWSLAEDESFDGAETPNGKSIIADPENIELNRAWVQFEQTELFDTPLDVKAKGGKQRILFDDQRFIGNVGWRQNEQTFNAALGQTNAGLPGLTVQYAYLWDIQRIFGNQGPSASSHDYDSDSHLARLSYGALEGHEFTAFAYLLDFGRDSPPNSANSYGARAAGRFPIDDDWTIGYSASYAFQTDAGRNAVDYEAHYGWAHVDAGRKGLGTLGVTYEHLGSDNGKAVFVTSLATAHKFNGFADAFLDNGGVRGLQDLAITVAPQLPWKLDGKIIYHEFWRADGGTHLGWEIDAVLKRPINEFLTALAKGAYLDTTSYGPPDRWRLTFELNFKY